MTLSKACAAQIPRFFAHSGQIVTLLPSIVARYLTSDASIFRPQLAQTSMALGAAKRAPL